MEDLKNRNTQTTDDENCGANTVAIKRRSAHRWKCFNALAIFFFTLCPLTYANLESPTPLETQTIPAEFDPLSPELWAAPVDFNKNPEWKVYSHTATTNVYSKKIGFEFHKAEIKLMEGSPLEIRVYTESSGGTETLKKIEILFEETGLSLARKKSADSISPTELPDQQEKYFANFKKNYYPKEFAQTKKTIESSLETQFGKGAHQSTSNPKNTEQIFQSETLAIHLIITTNELLQVVIEPLVKTGDPLKRDKNFKKELAENVESYPNGDRIIKNIPKCDQGPRGYCTLGTLAMVANYFQIQTTIDELAANSSQRTDGSKGVDEGVLNALKIKGRLLVTDKEKLDEYLAIRTLNQGIPIIVWRMTIAGGHASIITGYNPNHKLFLLTESWGDIAVNHPISYKELQQNTERVLILTPY